MKIVFEKNQGEEKGWLSQMARYCPKKNNNKEQAIDQAGG